ncbi:MAG TPA: hypothetical protein VNO18_13185 [Xanthobacteraceae bacterium]|jgi:hypothetical protein|nr:hypothetical protein [Xanthobacteraceae bacterium]
MDGYAFIEGLVKSFTTMIGALAWPAGIFGIVWLFRKKLNELLPLLILKHKDWQVSFGLDKAEEEAEKLPPVPAEAEGQLSLQEETGLAMLAKLSPRAAIMDAWARVDIAVNNFAQAVKLSSSRTANSMIVKELSRNELIDSNTVKLLNELRQIRNTVVHSMSEPTETEALRYQVLAGQLVRQFEIATGAAKMPPPGPISQ